MALPPGESPSKQSRNRSNDGRSDRHSGGTSIENAVPLVLSLLFLDARKIVSLVVFAPVVQRTIQAMWPDRLADELPKFYEDLVERKPIFTIR